MSDDHSRDGSITDIDEFEAVLADAIERAIEADVDVRGAWEINTSEACHDVEVEIIELAREPGDDD